MRINTNTAALNSYNQLNNTNNKLSKSLSRLSSGKRINGAADDAAGLAISEKMNAQTRGLAQAQRNAQDGISMIQTAEGALKESHSILQRMRELSVQSANDTNTSADREEIQKEVDQLANELTRISNNTEFNTQTLLNGAINEDNNNEAVFQIGSNEGQNINLGVNAMDADSLGVAGDKNVGEVTNATDVTSEEVDFSEAAGTELVDEASLTLSSDDTASVASVTVEDVTVETDSNSSAYNGYTVETVDDSTEGIEIDHDNQTITVTSDISNSATAADSLTVTETGTDPDADTDITFSGTATGENTDTLDGGVADDEVTLTMTNNDTSTTEEVIVNETATSVDFTSTEFDGLSLDLNGELDNNTAADIDIAKKESSEAVFDADGELTSEAVTYAGIDVSTQANADEAITTIDSAIETVSGERSKLGALQNRLDHTINNLNTSEENLTAAESRISDVDMAREMMNMSKQQILSQAGTAMMAQANQLPQGVLQLLG